MKRRDFLVCAAALPWAWPGFAATPAERAADLLADTVRDGLSPGAALVASGKGVVKIQQACGTYCSLRERAAHLTLETLHPLYSFSKLITGTVVAMTIQAGRLDYGDPVSKHIPEFMGEGREKVTLRHCLTHAAGLAKAPSSAVSDEAGWKAAVEKLCQYPLEWTPGSRTSYHGWSGAFLAAECVRRVSGGRPWPELCREKLFAPLGAKTLSFEWPEADQPWALVPQPNAEKPLPKSGKEAFSSMGQPGAGCLGTLPDALKVLQLHLQEGVWNAKRLIPREVFRQMHTNQFEREIATARAAGVPSTFEPWGLGLLLRGDGPATASHQWFGFADQASPRTFGHAGIDTLIGVGDLQSQVALVFATTNSPKPPAKTISLRNQVTNFVFKSLA